MIDKLIPRVSLVALVLWCILLTRVVNSEDTDAPKILSVQKASVQTVSRTSNLKGDSESESSKSNGPIVTAFTAFSDGGYSDSDAKSHRSEKNAQSTSDAAPKTRKFEKPAKVTVSVFEVQEPAPQKKLVLKTQAPAVLVPQPQLQLQPQVPLILPTIPTAPVVMQHFLQGLVPYPYQAVTYQPQSQRHLQQTEVYQTDEPAAALQSLDYYPQFGLRIPQQQPQALSPYNILGYSGQPAPESEQPQVLSPSPVETVQPQHQPQDAEAVAPGPEQTSAPEYNFAYHVHDSVSGTNHGHTEIRNGDQVQGRYALMDADGLLRTVAYTSDPVSGFNAVVNRQPPQNHVYNYQGSAQSGTMQGYFSYL